MGLYPSLLMQKGSTRHLVSSKFIVLSSYEVYEAMFNSQIAVFYVLLNMVVFRPKKGVNRRRCHIFQSILYVMLYFSSHLDKLLT